MKRFDKPSRVFQVGCGWETVFWKEGPINGFSLIYKRTWGGVCVYVKYVLINIKINIMGLTIFSLSEIFTSLFVHYINVLSYGEFLFIFFWRLCVIIYIYIHYNPTYFVRFPLHAQHTKVDIFQDAVCHDQRLPFSVISSTEHISRLPSNYE